MVQWCNGLINNEDIKYVAIEIELNIYKGKTSAVQHLMSNNQQLSNNIQ